MQGNFVTKYKLIYFVPRSHLELTKNSLFKIGCGVQGNYSHCSWEVEGTGQFLPEDLSNPTLGDVGKISRIQEFRVEILCPENFLEVARDTLLKNHPYEHPAYEFVKVKV